MKFVALFLAVLACVNALESSLKDKIVESLESFSGIEVAQGVELAQEAEGVQNCANKCNNVFNRMAYLVSTSGEPTYEWTACMEGCNQCTKDIANKAAPTNCLTYCKNYDWYGKGILKGVIEPDKACISGCIIQTCQGVCIGGTVDQPTKKNTKFFWPNGGCSIKTESYSQNADYVPWNSPNSGVGGDFTIGQCCSNALSLCLYSGPVSSDNFIQLLQNTGKYCQAFVPSKAYNAICTFYKNPQNCGQL